MDYIPVDSVPVHISHVQKRHISRQAANYDRSTHKDHTACVFHIRDGMTDEDSQTVCHRQ